MLLDTKNRGFGFSITTATAASPLICVAEYEDVIQDRRAPALVYNTAVQGGANTIIIPPPPANTARIIIELTLFNGDSVTHLIAPYIDESGGKQINLISLPTQKTLYYNRKTGWSVI